MHPDLIADRYELLEEIATGARSTVFRARDRTLNRVVAVKRRPLSLASAFDREVQALGRVHHANIVDLLDSGSDEAGTYLVLEHVEGETLGARIERERLTVEELLSWARQALAALNAVHAAGCIHRDVAPDNILLVPCDNGGFRVKLIDFELAQMIGQPVSDAATGSVHFMAPEQFEDRPLDERTDLYALGAVLYFAAAGEYPFQGDTNAQVITAHLRHRCEPLAALRPDIPLPLTGWISGLMSRDATERPATASEASSRIAGR